MWRTRRSWCRKLVQLNLWGTLYSSWALGLFPFVYSRKMRKLRRSWWLIGYGIIFTLSFVGITYFNYAETDISVMKEMFQRNPVAEQISYLHNVLLLLTLFTMHFRSLWLSEELGQILNELIHLQTSQLNKFESNDCTSFDNYIIIKGSIIMLELISMLAVTFGYSSEHTLKLFFGFIGVIVLQCGVLLFSMHFHLAVIHIYRAVWIINRELLRLVNRLSIEKIVESSNVHQLHSLYGRLLDLNIRLVAIYAHQVTLLMMSLLTINIISIFYIIVYVFSLKQPLTFGVVINFSQSFSINLIDFWMTISVCELAERASRGTSTILRLFNNIPQLDANLDRSLNDFALFCSHHRLKFNHCGLFHVHNAMGFRMIITSVLYLVYLVQFDFMNL